MNLPPEYRRPTTIAEAEAALEERRAATREWAAKAEASPGTPQYGGMLLALAAAELQAEFDVWAELIADRDASLKRIAEENARGDARLREISERAAVARERAALAQEKAATRALYAVIVAAVIALLTVIGMALREPPPVVRNYLPTISPVIRPIINVPQSPAPIVNVLPAPVVLPAPSRTPRVPARIR